MPVCCVKPVFFGDVSAACWCSLSILRILYIALTRRAIGHLEGGCQGLGPKSTSRKVVARAGCFELVQSPHIYTDRRRVFGGGAPDVRRGRGQRPTVVGRKVVARAVCFRTRPKSTQRHKSTSIHRSFRNHVLPRCGAASDQQIFQAACSLPRGGHQMVHHPF